MATRLHSIAIFVTDIDRALGFYHEALGLPVHKRGSFGAELLDGDVHLGVHPAVHPDAKALVGRHTGLTFYSEDLLHLCGELHERGIRFVSEPTQMSFGIMAMVADPDGNIVALWEDKLPDDAPHTH